ncbi:GGDEF domain-containing protein [Ruminococcus sp. FC2018]|uniref:GGDEF domain-containing protein n=1 Tax=Ruminococcus sp. FC2018 TaxID=1410617 RepID=UPI000490D05C|nr:GGDEF domain-containing protein [Ruminococcus sp. FC2018]
MIYSSIGIVAMLVQLIINYDVFMNKTSSSIGQKHKSYRHFLIGSVLYYITDIIWGFLDEHKLNKLLYADTVLYFLAMCLMVMLWTSYTTDYLDEKTRFGKALRSVGKAFFAMSVPAVIINFFYPILFDVTDECEYKAGSIRYIILMIQIFLFLLSSLHTLVLSTKTSAEKKVRYRAIGAFGIVMTALIAVQIYNPLLPVYSVGCMLGTCMLHTFIYEDEKAEYRIKLEKLLQQEKESTEALRTARTAANTDPLTGVKSRHAYIEITARIDRSIEAGKNDEFGVIVCDINDLKKINDTVGHEEGDRYIRDGCMMVCKKFAHSPVFRIGGDEFAVILERSDYDNREQLLSEFNEQVEQNQRQKLVEVSAGMAVFEAGNDSSFSDVFERADKKMYERKKILKAIQ